MGERTIKISDLSNQPIMDAGEAVKLVVLDHPLIERPVQLDAAMSELVKLGQVERDWVIVEVDGERVVLDVREFDALFNTGVDDVLLNAQGYVDRARTPSKPKNGTDYTLPDNAGLLHRGKVTQREKELVRADLARANENRRRAGQPPIDPSDARDREKYGLGEGGDRVRQEYDDAHDDADNQRDTVVYPVPGGYDVRQPAQKQGDE